MAGTDYYALNLNSQSLFRVYDTAIPRVRRYLQAEMDFVKRRLNGSERVLEVGAGYGRILRELAPSAHSLVGVDISEDSVRFGREFLKSCANVRLEVMDGHHLDFRDEFDAVLCLQNGLSAMKGEASRIVSGCLKAARPGGRAFFSTYSGKFWEHRLAWFEEQAEKGLLGEIDRERTRDGVIVCKDGFRARTFTEEDLIALGQSSGYGYQVQEVDESSLFLVITKS